MPQDENPTCDQVKDLMFLLATDDLEDELATTAYLHLAGCRECRQAMAEHVKLAAALFGVMGEPRPSKEE